METINNAVNAATEAVWPSTGEQDGHTTQTSTGSAPRSDAYNSGTTSNSGPQLDNKQEPLSGVLGNTKRGEPYDAGNKAEQDSALQGNRNSSFSDENAAYSTGGSSAYSSSNTNTNSGTNTNRNPAGTSGTAGAAGRDSSRATKTSVNDGQTSHDGRSSSNLDEKSTSRSGGNASSNASIVSGKAAGGGGGGGASGGLPPPVGANAASEVQTESQGEGTGEKYIRSTGFKADGGDFDAAREGAGREADRKFHVHKIIVRPSCVGTNRAGLLDQKGVSVTKPSQSHDVSSEANESSHSRNSSGADNGSNSFNSEHNEKKSFGNKIKEKLHHK